MELPVANHEGNDSLGLGLCGSRSMPMLKILDETKRLHIRAPEQIIEDSYEEARY
jgi:hypothetical protein